MPKRGFALLALAMLVSCNFPQAVPGITAAPASTATLPPAPTLPPAHTATAVPTSTATLRPTPAMLADGLALQQEALRPQFASDVEIPQHPTQYWIEVTVGMDSEQQRAELHGQARILFTNPLDQALPDLVLMLWTNDPQYIAHMTAEILIIEGEIVVPQIEGGGLALRAHLPQALQPGETLDVTIPFEVRSIGPMQPSDPHRFGFTEGVLLAPTFYPLVPRLVDEAWQIEEAPAGGDTTNSDVAFYHVQITSPVEYALAATGTEIDRHENGDGTQTATYVTGPVRDFAMALGPFQVEERKVEGVLLRAWLLPEHASQASRMLSVAATQMHALTAELGPYPYAELDVVDAPGAFGGIEYPGLVFIGTVGTSRLIEPLVHEIGHQWFYGLVGNDQLLQPWLDEAAATYTEVLYYEYAIGPERATTALTEFRQLVSNYTTDSAQPIGLPVAAYQDEGDYGLIVYAKGALFFDALRRKLGDEVFFAFLQSYFQAYRYGFADSGEFQAVAEETCACDLGPLFDLWVYDGGAMPGP